MKLSLSVQIRGFRKEMCLWFAPGLYPGEARCSPGCFGFPQEPGSARLPVPSCRGEQVASSGVTKYI